MPKLRQPTLPDLALLVILMVVVAGLAQALVAYLSVAGDALRFPYPLDYGEGPVLAQTMQLARGEVMYPARLDQAPYNVANYPPLFHLIQLPFALANGPAFWYGRAISMIAALASALFVGLIVHRLTGDGLASAVSGLLLLAFPHIAMWSMFNRVDTLGLALVLAALYVVLRWPSRALGIGLAAALFVAAVLTKPTFALAGPATAFAWLWFDQRLRRQALALIGVVAAASAVIYLALDLATGGGFLLNVIAANANEFALYRVVEAFINIFVHASFLLIAGFVYFVVERTTERTRSWSFALAFLLFSAASAMFVGKAGSSMNYLYELVAAICVLTGAAMAWLGRNPWLRVAALAVVALQVSDLNEWTQESYLAVTTSRMQLQRETEQLSALMRDAKGDVLADEFMGLLPINDKRIYIQPFEFTQLGMAGRWSDAQLIERINRRAFPAIALYEPMGQPALITTRWPKPVREAIYANYEMTGRLAEALIYTPK